MQTAIIIAIAGLLNAGPVQADARPAGDRIDSLAETVAALDESIEVAPPVAPEPESVFEEIGRGEASYYGGILAGHRTASGERFNPEAMTAAHRTVPFGTKLRVTNVSNGRSVIVRINDRGPFIRGRVIDISVAAAREIRMLGAGKAQVRLEIVRSA